MPDAMAAKMCSVCGVDCSTMKRAKDAQGRYICGDCLERAREAKVAKDAKPVVAGPGAIAEVKKPARVSPDGRDMVLDDLLSKSTASEMIPCTECGFPMQSKAILCTHCGFNKDAGRTMRTQVVKAPKEKKIKQSHRSMYISGPAVALLIIGVVAGCIAGAVLTATPALFYAGVVFNGLCGLVLGIMLVVDAFKNSPIKGIVILLGCFIPPLSLYTLYYVLTQADEKIRMGYLAYIVGIIVMVIAVMVMGDTLFPQTH